MRKTSFLTITVDSWTRTREMMTSLLIRGSECCNSPRSFFDGIGIQEFKLLEYCLDIVPGYSLDLVKPMAHEQKDVIDPTFSGGGGIFSCLMRACEDLLRIIPRLLYWKKKRFNFDNPVAKHCDFTSSMKSLGNSFAHLRDCRSPFVKATNTF